MRIMNNPLYDDERISAYLDGELSADEQSRFEERLAESAELRQLVEELRALRGSLDLLPRHKLEADFASHVLRRAEREMLASADTGTSGSNSGAPAAVAAPTRSTSPVELSRDPRDWRRRARRPLIYAAVAIAAAILIMVANPDRSKDKEVAQAPNRPKQVAPPEGELSARPSSGSLAKSAPTVNAQIEAEQDRNIILDRELKLRDSAGAPKAPLGESRPENVELRSGLKPELSKPEPEIGSTAAGGMQRRGDLAGGISAAGAKRQGDKAEMDEVKDANAPETPPKTPAIQQESDQPAARSDSLGHVVAGTEDVSTGRGLATNRSMTEKESLRRNAPVAGNVVVVQCFSAPEVAERTFERLVAKSDIDWRDSADGSALSGADTYAAAEKPREQLKQSNKKLTEPVEQGRTGLGLESLAEQKLAKDKEKRVEVVFVEGTTDQIRSLVRGLKAQPEVFGSVAIASAPTSSSGATSTFGYYREDTVGSGSGAEPLQFGNRVGLEGLGAGARMAKSRERGGNDSALPDSAPKPHAPADNRSGDRRLSDQISDELPANGPAKDSFGDFKTVSPETSKSAAKAPPAAAAPALNSPKDAQGPLTKGGLSGGRAAGAEPRFAENRAGKPAESATPAVQTDVTNEHSQTRGFALRLPSLPADADAAVERSPVEGKQTAADAPEAAAAQNPPLTAALSQRKRENEQDHAAAASQKAGDALGRRLGAPQQSTASARDGGENANLAKPTVAAPAETNHRFFFRAADSWLFGADRGELPETKMRVYFVFRRAPPPAAAAPGAEPPAAKETK
jgi:negative regulator of sigma E activity